MMFDQGYAVSEEELDWLLDVIYRNQHYDFRSYTRASMRRGVARAQMSLRTPTVAALVHRLQRDPTTFPALLRHLTIPVSDFFRDPAYFAALRHKVAPHLATYPSLRIWVAGCGTGEEAYSIAIVLHEKGLLERSIIYATDIATHSLEVAEAGVYSIDRVQGFSRNYFEAGGRASLSQYYTAKGPSVVFSDKLREKILFSDHSLATDTAFAEVQLVSCRNVLIYFNRDLQDRAIGLFRDAICPRGFLGIGSNEALAYSHHASAFVPFAADERLYRLKEAS